MCHIYVYDDILNQYLPRYSPLLVKSTILKMEPLTKMVRKLHYLVRHAKFCLIDFMDLLFVFKVSFIELEPYLSDERNLYSINLRVSRKSDNDCLW